MTDNRILIVNSLLEHTAEELDIPPSKYKEAVDRYTAVGRWLEAGQYAGVVHNPVVYPQGSFRLGTVVRPIKEDKECGYDIDLVCCLATATTDAKWLKQVIGDRLKEHGTYKTMLDKEGRRCWTLNYSEADGIGFHLDVLPSKPAPIQHPNVEYRFSSQAVALTDRHHAQVYDWGSTNPAGYADWFGERQQVAFRRVAALQKTRISRQHGRVYGRVDDVPDQLVRTPLQRIIQLLKRHRDARFAGTENESDKPISMIITTLAALAYKQESSVYEALAGFLDQVQRFQETGIIRCENDEWIIENPVNPNENFADRWNDEGSKRPDAFFQWINWVQEDIDAILNAVSHDELESSLTGAFGERTGKRIADEYQGPLPGAYQLPTSAFGRIAKNLLRFDVGHRQQPRWHISPARYDVRVSAKYMRNGFRPTAFRSNAPPLKKHVDLVFEAATNAPKPYKVFWQVVNTGDEAQRADQLRGDFYDSNKAGRSRTERTEYSGMHWVECFVVKNGVCVARSGEFIVNIE
ncbi:nucleotidyltransferase [Roseiconus lacunae]|uniref:Cyclic GMP-AMP synthase n=1 Tax=Roseiconus lacunae TaxID=2605694 RepID=A0ABT7PNV8_9BACT|nr:nucleotidyltransferase [Roseiconus lacunae]MDM4018167.1 nucleotidyltransferase [Roseiconus lacunae]